MPPKASRKAAKKVDWFVISWDWISIQISDKDWIRFSSMECVLVIILRVITYMIEEGVESCPRVWKHNGLTTSIWWEWARWSLWLGRRPSVVPFSARVWSILIRRKMVNVPAPDFQKLWSNQIASLRSEYKEAIQQHPNAGGVMERVRVVLTDFASLARCTPVFVGESPQWSEVMSAAETSRTHAL
jgi:hypothetical protein